METVPEADGRLRGEELREELEGMRLPDREQFMVAFMASLGELFCPHCWTNEIPCHCTNDE